MPEVITAGHGPHLSCEWWLSDDGRKWRRPFRDVFASGAAPSLVNHPPMTINGRHLWVIRGSTYGLPEDRVFFAGSMGSSTFTTPQFTVSKQSVTVNASLCYHESEKRGMRGQSFIMAEVLDENGQVIPKFEKDKCIIRHIPGDTQVLRWNGTSSWPLEGKNVSVRITMRDARVYALHC
jgi:hypothetical protein